MSGGFLSPGPGGFLSPGPGGFLPRPIPLPTAKALPTITIALNTLVSDFNNSSNLSSASGPRLFSNHSFELSITSFPANKNDPNPSIAPIIKSIIFSAVLAININIFPPGKLGLASNNNTRRRPNNIFFKKLKMPENKPFPGKFNFFVFPSFLPVGSTFSNCCS